MSAIDFNWTSTARAISKRYVLLADLPGVSPGSIDVSMENGILTLCGERETEAKTQREGYKRAERLYGSFHRRFSLPKVSPPVPQMVCWKSSSRKNPWCSK